MTRVESAHDCIDYVASQSKGAIVFLSLGKDSLVTLDLLYDKFDTIICVFMYFVKDLEHIKRWENWVKCRYPKITFLNYPHWNLTYILRGGLYCVPNPKQRLLKLADVVKAVKIEYGIDWAFLGMKKADSMNRRLMLGRMAEAHYTNNGLAYPLAEWTQKEILAYMKHKNLPEPVRYSKNASSGAGFDLDFFLWLRNNGYEGDLKKIFAQFPMSERILLEYDYKMAHAPKEEGSE